MSVTPSPSTSPVAPATPWEVFWVFLRLGLTSFGGPVAHLGYFRDEFVVRRRWLTEHSYADLVALCQFLPGPASSQVGMALGLMRGGWGGALAAWVGFTLPSALALALLGLGLEYAQGALTSTRLRDGGDALANTLGVLAGLATQFTPWRSNSAGRWVPKRSCTSAMRPGATE